MIELSYPREVINIADIQVIDVPELVPQRIKVTLKGTAPLIMHKFSQKAKMQILSKQQKKVVEREIRDPEKEYQESKYKDAKGNIAIPALWVKLAIVDAVRNVPSLTMTLVRGAVFVKGDDDGLIPLKFREERNREDVVRIGRGSTDLRYRAEILDWECPVTLDINPQVLSPVQVLNLLKIGGFSVGLGEWRPQRNGDFGTFEVKKSEEKES